MTRKSELTVDDDALRRPKLLYIDDDPDVSKAMKIRLERYGIDVIRAFNGMQGFWTGIDVHPDVIITDMSMPDGEGNYIYGRFQQNPTTKNIPVIVVSGRTNAGLKREMMSLGVTAYFEKPIVFEELLAELRHHIAVPIRPIPK